MPKKANLKKSKPKGAVDTVAASVSLSHEEATLIEQNSKQDDFEWSAQNFADKFAAQPVPFEERWSSGKAKRKASPLADHKTWQSDAQGRDPIEILQNSNAGRLPDLIPIRFGRMAHSPFAFFRGSAALMAHDLSTCPSSDVRIQCCGDCHLVNFGAFATPERNLVLDINDFDETLPADFEWDLKRLATSFVLAGRQNKFSNSACRKAAQTVVASYRKAMIEFSKMRILDVWYARFDMVEFIEETEEALVKQNINDLVKKTQRQNAPAHFYPKLTTVQDGRRIFREHKPLIYHSMNLFPPDIVKEGIERYRESLPDDKQALLSKFRLSDVAAKVVGVGSVGTLCGIALLVAPNDDALILQFKEARPSVLEPFFGASRYPNQGQRVVEGQRLMQAASDIFLGWTFGKRDRHFYIRQLRDMKMAPRPELWNPRQLQRAAKTIGWILARAQARAGDAALVAGYMGNSEKFDEAVAEFAMAYADQTEKDYDALKKAIESGRVEAYFERI